MVLDWPREPSSARAHIRLAHAEWAEDVKTKVELADCHKWCHERPNGNEIPHIHPGMVRPLPGHSAPAGSSSTGVGS